MNIKGGLLTIFNNLVNMNTKSGHVLLSNLYDHLQMTMVIPLLGYLTVHQTSKIFNCTISPKYNRHTCYDFSYNGCLHNM